MLKTKPTCFEEIKEIRERRKTGRLLCLSIIEACGIKEPNGDKLFAKMKYVLEWVFGIFDFFDARDVGGGGGKQMRSGSGSELLM